MTYYNVKEYRSVGMLPIVKLQLIPVPGNNCFWFTYKLFE